MKRGKLSGKRYEHWAIMFQVIILMLIFCNPVYPQAAAGKASRQSAMDAFSNGNYEKAYSDFSDLLLTFPRDPLYKYYSGISLVKLLRDPDKAESLLRDAAEGSVEVKSVPDDAWFYLGRAQQMSGQFSEAAKSYNTFSEKAGKKAARSVDVQKYIQECNEMKGELTGFEILQAGLGEKTGPEVVPEADKKGDSKSVRPKEILPPEYETVLVQTMNYQLKADSMSSVASGYKKELQAAPADQRPAIRAKIEEAESLAAGYQKLSDQTIKAAGSKPDKIEDAAVPVSDKLPDDAISRITVIEEEKDEESEKGMSDSTSSGADQTEEVYALFEIVKDTEELKNILIAIDPELPAGLIYRLQIAVFSKTVDPSVFRGITPVSGFRIKGSEVIRYFAGMFRRAADANKALLAVKQLGFKDAFLAAVLNGAPISLDRAAVVEKEWGGRSLATKQKPAVSATRDTTPPTLIFKVEVARSPKPVKDDMIENFRRIAGNRGLEIVNTTDGNFAYLIGKFITFGSAFDYADLLVRNGYRDARVVAWLGEREIPVETAKQLFERLE